MHKHIQQNNVLRSEVGVLCTIAVVGISMPWHAACQLCFQLAFNLITIGHLDPDFLDFSFVLVSVCYVQRCAALCSVG